MNDKKEIPIIYTFILIKLKEKSKTQFIEPNRIREIIARIIIRNGGFPKFLIRYIIEDLINFNILKKVNQNTYKILKAPQEKRIKFLINSCL